MSRYLIIAGSSEIGQATTKLLQNNGHEVFTTARDNTKINPNAILDATDFDAVEQVFQQAGNLDGVVNCCGSLWLKPAHLTTRSQFEDVISASLITAYATVHAAGKYLKNGGSVVLMASAAALTGFANHEAIAAAKAGVIGLTLSAAATYAPLNLRFNAVSPGLTETKLTESLTSNPTARNLSEAMHPLGRLGKPQEIAQAIVFLLDSKNAWITGQVVAVDGGLSSIRPKMKV